VRRTFGPKGGRWNKGVKKLHNEEVNDLFSWRSIVRVIKSRRMRWAGDVVNTEERRGAYRNLVGKPEGNRLFGRPRRRWENNVKMDFQKVGCVGMYWIKLAHNRYSWR
jgi:hypothetical protein